MHALHSVNRFCMFSLVGFFFVCCKSDEEKSVPKISIEVTDSINVDYLGILQLEGYDPGSDKYLLSNDGLMPILEVSSKGEILRNHNISHEGPNAIPNPGALGYLHGDLLIYDMQAGYFKLNDDNSVSNELKIPYEHSYLVFPPHLPLIMRTEDEAVYLKPLTNTDFVDGMGEKFFKNYYSKNLLEKLNLKTGTLTSHIKIPDQSVFKDGRNHGLYIPIIKKKGNEWLVSTWFDPAIYIYEERGDEFILKKSVDLQINDLVKYETVDMEKSDMFFEINSGTRPGHINDILLLDGYTVIVYRKGLDKQAQNEIHNNYRENPNLEIEKKDPFFAVVLDKEYNIVSKDVALPFGVYYPNVVNNNNEIVSLKNPNLFDVEENYITLYKMKLNVE